MLVGLDVGVGRGRAGLHGSQRLSPTLGDGLGAHASPWGGQELIFPPWELYVKKAPAVGFPPRLRAGLCDRCMVTQELAKKKQNEYETSHFQSLQHIFILSTYRRLL